MEHLAEHTGILSRLNDRVFSALMENANDAVFVLDEGGHILHGNRQGEKLLGMSREQMRGKPYYEFVAREDLDYASSQVGKIIEGSPGVSEVRLRRPDDSIVTVVFSSVMVDLGNEKVMMSIGRDVTEQKKAEAERMRLAAIVDSSGDAIYAMDLEGILNVWNAGAERLFGYSSKEVLGHYLFKIFPAERHHEALSMLEACKKGKTLTHIETARKDRQQEKIPISVNWFPLRDERGQVMGVSAIVRNLTERGPGEPQPGPVAE